MIGTFRTGVPASGAQAGDMTTTPPSAPTALDRFTATLRRSPVTRSQDRLIAGVAAGVAQRLGVSCALVRVGFIALALLGPGVPLYLLAWLLLPDAQGKIRLDGAIRAGESPSIVLLVVTVLSVLSTLFGSAWEPVPGGPGMPGMYGQKAGLWLLLVLAVLLVIGATNGWVSARHEHGHPDHRQQGDRSDRGQPPSAPPEPPAPPPPSPSEPQDAPRG
jgi:phage shock protein PspC (stress-responsive transcriptional regulator)